jgi:RecA/RadA recombinase
MEQAQGLGQFAEGFHSFQRTLAQVPESDRWTVFRNLAREASGYVAKGCGKVAAIDALLEIADAHGLIELQGLEEVEATLAEIFRDQPQPGPNGNGQTDWLWPEPPQTGPKIPIINPLPAVLSTMPRRPWLVPGLLLRRQVTLLVAPPGSGKSLLTLQLALMACVQMPEWGGWRPRAKYRVLIINVEEDQDEMTRRLGAAAKVMQIEQDELGGLYLAKTDTIVVARADSRTKTVIATPMLGEIERVIVENQIDIVVVDPFAETFAGDENSNSELKWAAILWRDIARKTNTSVMLIHHAKKYSGNMAGDPDAGRGAGALTGVARIVATLFGMTEKEADGFADQQCVDGTIFDPEQRNRYIRFDDAKANQSLVSIKSKWFYKTSVSLDNAGDGEPADEVGVLVPWKPPTIWSRMDNAQANLILDHIARGFVNDDGSSTGDSFTMAKQSGKRWAGTPITSILQCDDKDAAAVLKKWISEGVIDVRKAVTGKSKGKERDCAFVNNSKRPGVATEEVML